MQFHLPTAEIYIPDGLPVEQALARTAQRRPDLAGKEQIL